MLCRIGLRIREEAVMTYFNVFSRHSLAEFRVESSHLIYICREHNFIYLALKPDLSTGLLYYGPIILQVF
jgi:hypothetical protein